MEAALTLRALDDAAHILDAVTTGKRLATLGAAFALLPPGNGLLSVAGTVIINMVVAINYKPGRYLGVT